MGVRGELATADVASASSSPFASASCDTMSVSVDSADWLRTASAAFKGSI